jgi:hypothetical protein
MMRSQGTNPGHRPGAVIAVCVICLLVSMIALRATMELAIGGAIEVGTLIRFSPARQRGLSEVDVTATRLAGPGRPAGTCTLSAAEMKTYGGSLMVEADNRRTGEVRAYWAGARTAPGAGNCGRTALLMLSADDVQALADAASGLGPGAVAALTYPSGGRTSGS